MKNPRFADNPLNLTQVPNGAALSGQVFFEIPINPQLSRMPIALWVDGVASPDAVLDKDASGKWGMFFETRHSLNGAHILQLVFQYRSLPTFYGQPTRVSGARKNVQFNNQAIYNPTAARFERALVVDAILPSIPTANYDVDVYDDQGTLLATTSGQTTDGSVTAVWNTVDPQGNPTVNGNLEHIK